MNDFLKDPRFAGIKPFSSKVLLSSPTMHWGPSFQKLF